jgi:hypothetical protein
MPRKLCPLPFCDRLLETGHEGAMLLLLPRREDVKDREPGALQAAPIPDDLIR